MATSHINGKPGDFAKVVLMPGDPLRAAWIAQTFLTDAIEITDIRGMLGFTGYTKNGKRISVMASGMGQPSIGIYSYELFNFFGVETIIRVGTCGSYQENINIRDVLICTTACTDSNWTYQYGIETFSAGSDLELTMSAYNVLKKRGIPFHYGAILSADIFYDNDKELWKKWADMGVMGVEMESYALYCTAARFKKRALCFLTVTDHFLRPEKLTPGERQSTMDTMMEAAIEAAEPFCD